MLTIKKGILLAMLAAALYALSTPFSKLLLADMSPTFMAGFLYLGAGLGMMVLAALRRARRVETKELSLTKKELPYTIAMIVLDIIAPICLMCGLQATSAQNAALLNNFEIVATAIIALLVFHEKISARLWSGIVFVTLSCIVLTFDPASLQFSSGSLLVLLAAVFWGLENNCTRKLSSKDPLEIVLLKGLFSGMGSLLIALCIGEQPGALTSIFFALILGFVAYGLSIYAYVYAQRYVGAARTSAYYAIAPFISAGMAMIIFRDRPGSAYLAALCLMAVGAWLCAKDEPLFQRTKQKQRS